MKVNRRGFLKGLAGAAAIVASRLASLGRVPVRPLSHDLYVKGLTFVGKGLEIPAGVSAVLENCTFIPTGL